MATMQGQQFSQTADEEVNIKCLSIMATIQSTGIFGDFARNVENETTTVCSPIMQILKFSMVT